MTRPFSTPVRARRGLLLPFVLSGVLLVASLGLGACGGGADQAASTTATTTATADDGADKQLYTCGMHPQVVQDHPGTCPICGMNLTPMNDGAGGGGSGGGGGAAGERKIAYWRAPMDPTYIRDKPGKSPMGMDLIPVYEDELSGPDSNIVSITPGVVQQIGVETAPVRRTTVFRHLRTIGEVEVGEDEVSVVNLRYSGWVERIYVERTGDEVRKGQVLFDIYSPELVAAQEEYLLAIRTQGADSDLARSARRRLELWDIADRDIDAIVARGEARRTLPVRARASGFVLHKDIVEGARVTAGKDLYRIGNLQRIWVTAEVYEHDAPWVEEGQPAQLELTYQGGETLEGRVSYIYPTLNRQTRTLTVRLEFDNPGVRLKPGMFATVYIQYRRKDDTLAVPTEAILHSGKRQIAFVALGEGRFQPREVKTGIVGDRHMTEVLDGLHEGDRVVVSSQFLIDSESQLQEALRKIIAGAKGRSADAAKEAPPVYTCPMHPEVRSDEPGRCPQCGMDLVPVEDDEHAGAPHGHGGGGEASGHDMGDMSGHEMGDMSGHDMGAMGGTDGPAAGASGETYTCPMHPDVHSDSPGRCPECGMFLEKVAAPGSSGDAATGDGAGGAQ
ncbi:MAG: efflux RND transporter periplasmic adaptor subunit [Deltaproteobacteria bacterium]|nr:MAG: efflux RND transporter periplasmic adaptor subunit [Deltaproteobacteria bacterium]